MGRPPTRPRGDVWTKGARKAFQQLREIMTAFRFLILGLLSPFAILSARQLDSLHDFDWVQFQILWTSYLTHSTSANAKKVIDLIPYPDHVHYTQSSAQDSALECMEGGFATLRNQIYAGNSSAVKLAFRLFCLSDGDYSESLDQILGGMIVRNPTTFLEQLNAHSELFGGEEFTYIGTLVGNFGDRFVDDMKAQIKESHSRIGALLKVKRPDLLNVRNRCINHLRDKLELISGDEFYTTFDSIEAGMSPEDIRRSFIPPKARC